MKANRLGVEFPVGASGARQLWTVCVGAPRSWKFEIKFLPDSLVRRENVFMKTPMKRFVFVAVFVSASAAPLLFSKPEGKVTICHRGHTITVAEEALKAHLAHGDTVGPCQITETQR